MIIKYTSDDGTVETRHVHRFQKAGTVEMVSDNGHLLGIFAIAGVQDGKAVAEVGAQDLVPRRVIILDAEADEVIA